MQMQSMHGSGAVGLFVGIDVVGVDVVGVDVVGVDVVGVDVVGDDVVGLIGGLVTVGFFVGACDSDEQSEEQRGRCL